MLSSIVRDVRKVCSGRLSNLLMKHTSRFVPFAKAILSTTTVLVELSIMEFFSVRTNNVG